MSYFLYFFFNALSRDPCIKSAGCQNDTICHPKGDQKVLILDPSKKNTGDPKVRLFEPVFMRFLTALFKFFMKFRSKKITSLNGLFECTRKNTASKKKYSAKKKIKKYTGDPKFCFF